MGQITPEQGLQALERLMRSEATQACLIPVNWLELQRHYPASSSAPMLSALMARRAPRPASSEQVVRIQRSQLLSAETPARQAMLVSYLREKISNVLGASPASLDEHEALTNMGLDSLMALELKNRIDADLELGLPLVQLLQGPSMSGLASYLAESLADSHAEEALTSGQEIPHKELEIDVMIEKLDAPGLLSNLGQLSDDQVEMLLRELSDDEG
jgi:aryl carrier-like protein